MVSETWDFTRDFVISLFSRAILLTTKQFTIRWIVKYTTYSIIKKNTGMHSL